MPHGKMDHVLPLRILLVDDDLAIGRVLTRLLEREGAQVRYVESGSAALGALAEHEYDVVLSDLRMPGMDGLELLARVRQHSPRLPFVILTAHGSVAGAVDAMRRGASDFLGKPADPSELALVLEKCVHRTLDQSAPRSRALIGDSDALVRLRVAIERAAQSQATVLLLGETGTGKELVASALHMESKRHAGPLVRVNCAALPESLLESELFGHERGAFTGAVHGRPGRIELAEGGTLFLDEIGDISAKTQVQLLRVLQEHTYERVGGTRTLHADVRFVTATNRDLPGMVRAGTFREDLLYRLDVVRLSIAPLRERPEDIGPIAEHVLDKLQREHGRRLQLTPAALAFLQKQTWPGNVRQLENLLERLLILGDTLTPTPRDLEAASSTPLAAAPDSPRGGLADERRRAERSALEQALTRAHGNRSLAARLLGVSRRTLYNKLAELGVDAEPGARSAP